MTYGALTRTDIDVLEAVLACFQGRSLAFTEIGIHTGTTARGIRDYCAANRIRLEYTGIDNGTLHHDLTVPFEGARLIVGNSAEVFHLAPVADVILVDGAHARNDVILDTYNYAPRVRIGGFLLFHDTSPEIQHTMREAYGPDIPPFYNAVNDALDMMRWPWPGWYLWRDDYERGAKFGGMRAYRREG